MSEQKIIDEEGHFHAEDEVVDLSGTIAEGWIALALFWLLGLTVFYQFVTRYVFNDSASWTEEVARYMLIGVVFIGASTMVMRVWLPIFSIICTVITTATAKNAMRSTSTVRDSQRPSAGCMKR